MIRSIEWEIEEIVSLLRKEFDLIKVNLRSNGKIEAEGVWAIPMSEEFNKIALSESPSDLGKAFYVAILNKPVTDGWNNLDFGSSVVAVNNGPNRPFATKEKNFPSPDILERIFMEELEKMNKFGVIKLIR